MSVTSKEVPLNSHYKIKTLNRLKLYYVNKLPTNIKFSKIEELFDKFDLDIIQSILEKGIDLKNETTQSLIYTQPHINVEYIYIENVYELTFAHVLLLLNKFPNAQIIMFLTTDQQPLPNISILDTHASELNIEGLGRKSKKRKLSEDNDPITNIDAKKLLEQLKIEIENQSLWEL